MSREWGPHTVEVAACMRLRRTTAGSRAEGRGVCGGSSLSLVHRPLATGPEEGRHYTGGPIRSMARSAAAAPEAIASPTETPSR